MGGGGCVQIEPVGTAEDLILRVEIATGKYSEIQKEEKMFRRTERLLRGMIWIDRTLMAEFVEERKKTEIREGNTEQEIVPDNPDFFPNSSIMENWEHTGCSILASERMTFHGTRLFIDFYVNSPAGTLYLNSFRINQNQDQDQQDQDLCHWFTEVIEKVGVEVVVQKIDFILEDFRAVDWVNDIIERAKLLMGFLCKNPYPLDFMRTLGLNLIGVDQTRSSTDFNTLERLTCVEQSLKMLVSTKEWEDAEKNMLIHHNFVYYILSDAFWGECKRVHILVGLLLSSRRLTIEKTIPSLRYVFAALYRVKETIKKDFLGEYETYWNMIDHRIEAHSVPLYKAGFYFSPIFFRKQEPILDSAVSFFGKILHDDNVAEDRVVYEQDLYNNNQNIEGNVDPGIILTIYLNL
ncbi:uncharacterized protein LOC118489216 [Helianthus annuus]|uniref:uncharacterized protein LOC118489216 n=1 Tax=Helianthus annuus TaxID=4232 RepID=UPI001653069A|nr:uncharacterized protein LOC118489216 [Helianthus annuus]